MGPNDFLFESEAMDLDLTQTPDIEAQQNPTFGGTDALLGIEEDELVLEVDETEFLDSNLDLGIMDVDPQDTPALDEKTVELTDLVDKLACHLSSNPSLVTALNKGVTAGKLDLIGSAINADLNAAYNSDKSLNVFVNAIAAGLIVSDHFEKTIPSTVKVYYVPVCKRDSIHLHTANASGLMTYKATPAITSFDLESVNKVGAVYAAQIRGFDTLSSYLEDACFKPISTKSQDDSQAFLAFDNLTLAKNLSKSKLTIDAGMAKLTSIGCNKPRRDKIAVLAKALRDSQ